MGKKKKKMLVFGGDVEGHLGKDNQFYMLDFSRVLPPVRPPFLPPLEEWGEEETEGGEEEDRRRKEMWQNSHLYLLFRSEFLKRYQLPLCSDGYSLFCVSDPLRFVFSCCSFCYLVVREKVLTPHFFLFFLEKNMTAI